MSETQVKKLKAEKERLKNEAEFAKNIIKVSEACSDLLKFISSTEEPFDSAGNNPYTKKISQGLCSVI